MMADTRLPSQIPIGEWLRLSQAEKAAAYDREKRPGRNPTRPVTKSYPHISPEADERYEAAIKQVAERSTALVVFPHATIPPQWEWPFALDQVSAVFVRDRSVVWEAW